MNVKLQTCFQELNSFRLFREPIQISVLYGCDVDADAGCNWACNQGRNLRQVGKAACSGLPAEWSLVARASRAAIRSSKLLT